MTLLARIQENTVRLHALHAALLADLETIGVEVVETDPTLAQLLAYVGELDLPYDETAALDAIAAQAEVIGVDP